MFPLSQSQRWFHSCVLVSVVLGLWGVAWQQFPVGAEPLASARWLGAGYTPLWGTLQRGKHAHILQPKERRQLLEWMASGRSRAYFYQRVMPVVKQRCVRCHGRFQRGKGVRELSRLAHFDDVARVPVRMMACRGLLQQVPGVLFLLFLVFFWLQAIQKRRHWPFVGWWVSVVALGVQAIGHVWSLASPWGLMLAAYAPLVYAITASAISGWLLRCWWGRRPNT